MLITATTPQDRLLELLNWLLPDWTPHQRVQTVEAIFREEEGDE